MALGLNLAQVIGRLGDDVTINHLASGGRVANMSDSPVSSMPSAEPSIAHAQPGRALLQQTQTISAYRNTLGETRRDYLVMIRIATIRIWLRANGSMP